LAEALKAAYLVHPDASVWDRDEAEIRVAATALLVASAHQGASVRLDALAVLQGASVVHRDA
jgi:hypothetical protein